MAALDPPVFERVVAEIVARGDNRGVQIYGRSGQTQHGLDIVAREKDGTRSLYQAKRFQVMTGAALRAAVERYAGPPRPADYDGQPRHFGARRFVIATSAELDSEDDNVNSLAALQGEYEGDLEIEVWGAEALSRSLRDAPHLVYAVFGPEWARVFCGGFEPAGSVKAGPKPLGLVESPVEVLGLELTEADALAAHTTDPLAAARLWGVVAQGLGAGGFPGHAAAVRRRQASAALAGGRGADAFATTFEIALDQVLAGWGLETYGLLQEVAKIASTLSEIQQAECLVLKCIARWYEDGTRLAECVPALRLLTASSSPHLAVLSCLVLEQALVDGLYESVPAKSTTATVDDSSAAHLAELQSLVAATDCRDVTIRARSRCAVADSKLPLDATPAAVSEVYDPILRDALAGRLRHASGLVASRAAYAYAMHGDADLRLSEIKPSTIVSWINGRRAAGLDETTIGLILTHLSAILEQCVDDELIYRNPCRTGSVRSVKPKRSKKSAKNVPLTGRQVAAVRENLPARYKTLTDVGRALGLRQGEIFALSPDDIDWTNKKVCIRRQLAHDGDKLVFAAVKASEPGEERERWVPVPDELAFRLIAHMTDFPPVEVTLPWDNATGPRKTVTLLFTSREGKALNSSYFNWVWKAALEAAGIITAVNDKPAGRGRLWSHAATG